MYKIIDGNKAAADVAYLFSDISSIYPITPSSPMATEVDINATENRKNIFDDNLLFSCLFLGHGSEKLRYKTSISLEKISLILLAS